jgi:hypothetical protein
LARASRCDRVALVRRAWGILVGGQLAARDLVSGLSSLAISLIYNMVRRGRGIWLGEAGDAARKLVRGKLVR